MSTPTLSHNLPPSALALIARGVEKSDNRVRLFNATQQVAYAAVERGWSETDWRNAMQDGIKNGGKKAANALWYQITHRRRRTLNWETVNAFLAKCWAWAVENVGKKRRPRQDCTDDLMARIDHHQARLDNPLPGQHLLLSPSDEGTLRYALSQFKTRKFATVTLPCRVVGDAVGICHKAAYKSLHSLADLGILVKIDPGTWMGLRKNHGGKAAIYALAEPGSLRGSPTLPPEKASDQPLSQKSSAPSSSTGTHTPSSPRRTMCTYLSLKQRIEDLYGDSSSPTNVTGSLSRPPMPVRHRKDSPP